MVYLSERKLSYLILLKKISNNIKDGMALAGRAIKTNNTLNQIGQFVDDVTGLGYIKGKLNSNKVKKR